jgi:hypothetical protein
VSTRERTATAAARRLGGSECGVTRLGGEELAPARASTSVAPPWLRRTAFASAVVLLGSATIALGAFAGLGLWLVAVLGGAVLGSLMTLVALGIYSASSEAPAPRQPIALADPSSRSQEPGHR